jgi:hypothetical protein
MELVPVPISILKYAMEMILYHLLTTRYRDGYPFKFTLDLAYEQIFLKVESVALCQDRVTGSTMFIFSLL